MEIRARNVHEALPKAIDALYWNGARRESRNGPVYEMQEPVMTVFEKPLERVLFWKQRDANPFFHFFESLWMLAGRDDVAFPALFTKNIAQYSDNGKIFHGAYGFRWRTQYYPMDQLAFIIDRLRKDPEDRRCVLQMWDCKLDLKYPEEKCKDLPCNISALFLIRADGKLHMTVNNRSNDIIWGLFGANAVHFSYLLEYMAMQIGVEVGTQTHVSNNFHGYVNTFEPLLDLRSADSRNPYRDGSIIPFELGQPELFDKDLELFFRILDVGSTEWTFKHDYQTHFFQKVVVPLLQAHRAYKQIKGVEGIQQAKSIVADHCIASDWATACFNWLEVRRRNLLEKKGHVVD